MDDNRKQKERWKLADGTVIELYMQSDILHREDGPAWRMQDAAGRVVEMYFRNGKLDRLDGPAFEVIDPSGAEIEGFFRNGVHVDPPELPKPSVKPPRI